MTRAARTPAPRARLAAAGLAAVYLLLASPALASEQSQLQSARGLAEFHAARYGTALERFDAAVAADPADPFARYYRGVTRLRLGDADGAVADLRLFVAARPSDGQGALELGFALTQAGQYREALGWLDRARTEPSLAATADFFSGWALLRDGDLDGADAGFARAELDPRIAGAARFYRGVVAYRRRQFRPARDRFAPLAGEASESAIGREAARYLRVTPGGTPYELYAAAGLEYDSNIILAPSDEAAQSALQITNQGDGRFSILFGGSYAPWRGEHAELRVGYDFFQSLYFDLSQFDYQSQRPWVRLSAWRDWLAAGVDVSYGYSLLDFDSFLQEAVALPWLRLFEGQFGYTEILYRYRWRDYLQAAYANSLNAQNDAVGIRQVAYLRDPRRYVWLGYRFDANDATRAQGAIYSYDGNELDTGLGWGFPGWDSSAEVGYRYRDEAYAPASEGRHDEEHRFSVVLDKQIGEHWTVTAAYFGTLNHSNQVLYRYNRQIGLVQVEVRY